MSDGEYNRTRVEWLAIWDYVRTVSNLNIACNITN